MGSTIRIVVAEKYPGLCELFREQLSAVPDYEVVGSACTGRAAIAAVARLNPDIVTVDTDLPDIGGLEILQVIRWCSPNTKAIVLSGRDGEEAILEALELGARGYLNKNGRTDLIKAIQVVQNGEVWARRQVVARALERLAGLARSALQETGGEPAPA